MSSFTFLQEDNFGFLLFYVSPIRIFLGFVRFNGNKKLFLFKVYINRKKMCFCTFQIERLTIFT